MSPGAWGRVLPAAAWLLACATTPATPSSLRGYEVVVPDRDTLADAMAEALSREGLRVRRDPRGGARAPAVLVSYEFREPGPDGQRWLEARLFHARSAVVLAAARLPVDSLPAAGRARARLLAAALLAPPDTSLTIDAP